MPELALSFEGLEGGRLGGPEGFGRPALIVNTASECGCTPQYAGLQRLWQRYGPRGLLVLGVPCNDFGAQEPGSPAQVAQFCNSRYAVSFPLAAKAEILGAGRHPFYQSVATLLGEDQLPRWNFHKYLVGRDGALLGTWPSQVDPEDPELVAAIEAALA
ncbi:MAG TPA: glutathione peroxidase [Solimonas sp.]|nr:glutathione peroxidase [Solimonas sp.]